MKWNQSLRSDMCITEHPDMRRMEVDMNYYDENSWEPLDAKLVVACGKGGDDEVQKDAGVHVRE